MGAIPEGEFTIPIFPLPDTVFFPDTRLPLHVFEPRYREMVRDALDGDERIGIVLLEPGWEADYLGAPAVHSLGTAGLIEHATALEDGRYNILLGGQVRFRIIEEIQTLPYRIARVAAAPESSVGIDVASDLQARLVDLSRRYLGHLPGPTDLVEFESVTFGELANALVMSLTLDAEDKQFLLEIDSMLERAQRVGELLETRLEALEFLAPYRQGGDPAFN
jgi:uncharacterized protein